MARKYDRQHAERVITERFRKLRGSEVLREKGSSHTKFSEDNLISGVEENDFWTDLSDGSGNELVDSGKTPAKFCAIYSSSALAVNNFGPFRNSPNNLVLANKGGFHCAKFERKCPTPLRGTPPHLDFLVYGSESIVAVESKFLELLAPKQVKFAESYRTIVWQPSESAWQTMYDSLVVEPTKFTHLDAGQLVKHYLGIRHTFRDWPQEKVLMYVFWEPKNAGEIPEYITHRKEVDLFSEAVSGSEINFVSISYPELWNYWSRESNWTGMAKHIEALKERYSHGI